jgi:hypothetical protein
LKGESFEVCSPPQAPRNVRHFGRVPLEIKGAFYQENTTLSHRFNPPLLFNCVKIRDNILAQNVVTAKLIGSLDNPCLAIPLNNFPTWLDLGHPN